MGFTLAEGKLVFDMHCLAVDFAMHASPLSRPFMDLKWAATETATTKDYRLPSRASWPWIRRMMTSRNICRVSEIL